MEKKETFKCFVYGIEVQVIEGICQEDCSIEECNLKRDMQQPGDEEKKEGAGSDNQ